MTWPNAAVWPQTQFRLWWSIIAVQPVVFMFTFHKYQSRNVRTCWYTDISCCFMTWHRHTTALFSFSLSLLHTHTQNAFYYLCCCSILTPQSCLIWLHGDISVLLLLVLILSCTICQLLVDRWMPCRLKCTNTPRWIPEDLFLFLFLFLVIKRTCILLLLATVQQFSFSLTGSLSLFTRVKNEVDSTSNALSISCLSLLVQT